jgi:nitric oxide reductase activation protein
MLVVSDGLPNGKGYTGAPAIKATKQAVQEVKRQGIKILNIAIADYKSEAIFGKANVLKFTNLPNLVENMRRLIVRLVRSAS